MVVLHTFFKVIKKNLSSISIYFIIFAAIAILITGSSQENDVTKYTEQQLSVCIFNEDTGMLGDSISSYLGSIHTLVELENNKNTLQDALFYQNVDYILFIPTDFTDRLKAGDTTDLLETVKHPNGTAGSFVDTQLETFLNKLYIYLESGFDEASAVTHTNQDLSTTTPVIVEDFNTTSIWEKEAIYYFFQYLPYIFLCIIIMGVAPILSIFQEKELNARNTCSALTLRSKNFQLALGCILYCLLCYGIFILLAAILYPDKLFTLNGILCMVNAFATLLFSMSVAFLTGMILIKGNSSNVVSMISNTLGLSFSFLGGVFVPLAVMDESVLKVSKFIPFYWYSKANDILSVTNEPTSQLSELGTCFAIQFGFAIAIFAITLFLLRVQMERD